MKKPDLHCLLPILLMALFGTSTEAAYGEGSSLSEHKDRYTEKVPLYSLNSMVRRLQRHGLKDDGIYGKIDNLHITLDGNRVSSVKEDAERVTYPGGMEYDGGQTEQAMEYDEAGNLTSDGGRGITSVTYDMFNRPLKVTFSGGDTSEFVHSADGEKLSVTHSTSVARAVAASGADLDADSEEEDEDGIMALASMDVDKTEYRGFAVYKDSKPYMLLFRGGYVTFDGGVTFHYYTQDYLGNNRAVVNASTGALEQTVAYYPFGGVIADLGTGHSLQQYKFGGKELYTANGLNEYDLGARRYYQAVPMFTQPDPFAEKFPWLSPYAYCANNPVNLIDPDGMIAIYNKSGDYLGHSSEGYTGQVYIYSGTRGINFSQYTESEIIKNYDVTPLDAMRGGCLDSERLSEKGMSKIWSHIVSQFDGLRINLNIFSVASLQNECIDFQHISAGYWQTEFSPFDYNKAPYIYGDASYPYETTIENVASSIIVHEWYSHAVMKYGDYNYTHRYAFKNVIDFNRFWDKTTTSYKQYNLDMFQYVSEKETGNKLVDPFYFNLYNNYVLQLQK